MRIRRFICWMSIVALSAGARRISPAQNAGGYGAAELTSFVETIGSWNLDMAGLPYVSSWKSTENQILANGQPGSVTLEGATVRDSAGRQYSEMHGFYAQRDTHGEVKTSPWLLSFTESDPIRHTVMSWSGGGQVSLMHIPGMHQATASDADLRPCCWVSEAGKGNVEWSVVWLGKKTLRGLEAVGLHATAVMPPYSMGKNADPVTLEEERWYSPELHMTLLNTLKDSRSGVSTFEVTEIERKEPEARLFQIPVGACREGNVGSLIRR